MTEVPRWPPYPATPLPSWQRYAAPVIACAGLVAAIVVVVVILGTGPRRWSDSTQANFMRSCVENSGGRFFECACTLGAVESQITEEELAAAERELSDSTGARLQSVLTQAAARCR